MKRTSLRDEFHGEPDMAQEGANVEEQGPDEVTIEVIRGTLTLRVSPTVPDDQVLSPENLDRFLQLVLELEDGSELTFLLDEDREGVDVRRETSEAAEKRQKSESQLDAEKSPRRKEH